jgi:hypothetical protein
MSTELSNYLAEMNKVYDEALSNIKKQKEENPTLKFPTLLLNNNEKIKEYVIHLSLGSDLSKEEDNKTAYKELLKTHTDFTNFMLSL